jgi:hypothetical protein
MRLSIFESFTKFEEKTLREEVSRVLYTSILTMITELLHISFKFEILSLFGIKYPLYTPFPFTLRKLRRWSAVILMTSQNLCTMDKKQRPTLPTRSSTMSFIDAVTCSRRSVGLDGTLPTGSRFEKTLPPGIVDKFIG